MSFLDVPDRLPSTICVGCRKLFNPGDALVEVFTVAGVGPGAGQAKTVFVNERPEYAHLKCARPGLRLPQKKWIARSQLKPELIMPVDELSPDYQCLACAGLLSRGHRILMVLRAEGIDKDPLTNAPGLRCTTGHETAHLNCSDPKCTGEGRSLIING